MPAERAKMIETPSVRSAAKITAIAVHLTDGGKDSFLRGDNQSGEEERFPHIGKVDAVLDQVRLPIRFIPYDDHGFL